MNGTRLALLAALFGLALALTPASADRQSPSPSAKQTSRDGLTPESFAQLHRVLCLQPGEYRWDEIPWLASVWRRLEF